jgi:hypothetical protein
MLGYSAESNSAFADPASARFYVRWAFRGLMFPHPPIFCSRFSPVSFCVLRERTHAPQPSRSRALNPPGRQTPCCHYLPLSRSLLRKGLRGLPAVAGPMRRATAPSSACPPPLPLRATSARRTLRAGHSSTGTPYLVAQLSAHHSRILI